MSDVGNVDSDLESTVVVLDDVKSVVEISSSLRVDREHRLVSIISSNVLIEFSCSRYISENSIATNDRRTLGDLERSGRETSHDALGEIFGGEVAILEQRRGFRFDISNLSEAGVERSEGVQRRDGPPLDTGDEEGAVVLGGVLNKVVRSLIGRCFAPESVRRHERGTTDERMAIRGTRLSVGRNQMIFGV